MPYKTKQVKQSKPLTKEQREEVKRITEKIVDGAIQDRMEREAR
jgi:hypothetical protein